MVTTTFSLILPSCEDSPNSYKSNVSIFFLSSSSKQEWLGIKLREILVSRRVTRYPPRSSPNVRSRGNGLIIPPKGGHEIAPVQISRGGADPPKGETRLDIRDSFLCKEIVHLAGVDITLKCLAL